MQIHLKDFQVFGSLQKHFDLILCALDTLRDCTSCATEGSAAFVEIQNLERNGDEILRSAIQQLDSQLSDYPPREGTRRMLGQQDSQDAWPHTDLGNCRTPRVSLWRSSSRVQTCWGMHSVHSGRGSTSWNRWERWRSWKTKPTGYASPLFAIWLSRRATRAGC